MNDGGLHHRQWPETIDAVSQEYALTPAIAPRLTEFESFINDRMAAVAGND